MTTREEFGKYLLLKKLTEDALGESFRAGRLGRQGLEQVVLLRVLNGPGIRHDALWSELDERTEVQTALKSPNIGNGVDADRVRGVPYTAYDYISGKDLASLMAQADAEMSPFPTDHALLIAERIGLALAAAHETRFDGQRILHGAVVPQLVMISNEGEIRLLGFEVGPALAAQAPALAEDARRYLSPEARAGSPGKDDDVFSVGAILYELLTGDKLPVDLPEGGAAALVGRAQLASEGTAVPGPIASLLEKSLAPRGQRFGDISEWHKACSRLMNDQGFNPTTFNLAFFMHNLFRDEIERESREIEAEKTLELPPRGGAETVQISGDEVAQAGGPLGAAQVPPPATLEAGAEETTGGGSKAALWVVLALLLLAGAGGAAWWFLAGPGSGDGEPDEAVATQPEPVEVPPEPQGPTPEELQAQIDSMLSEKTQAMEENLRESYDDRIAQLQEQLREAENAQVERDRLLEQQRQQQAAEAEAEAARQEQARQDEADRRAELRRQEQADREAAEPEPAAGEPGPADATRQAQANTGASGGGNQAAGTPPAQESAPAEPAEPEPEPVREGELVTALGPGIEPPTVVDKQRPSYPPMARRLNRTATVDVRVLVDENGRVTEAEVVGDEAGLGFDEAAMRAAQRSTFRPATKNGVRVKMWTTLRFVFQ